jgi:hypothetical protein
VVIPPVRLRQVVVIARDLPGVEARLSAELGVSGGFVDEGVGFFGLENRVIPAGGSFIEVLTPVSDQSAGHRYLERRGADGGYMAIFQFRDRDFPRLRAAELGIPIVWQGDHDDISGTHLDPRDVPGAIVSLDWADPPDSWHWAGPAWSGPNHRVAEPGGVVSLEVAVVEPAGAAARWAQVLGPDVELDGTRVMLPAASQMISFVAAADRRSEGITGCGLALAPVEGMPARRTVEIAGVRFDVVEAD